MTDATPSPAASTAEPEAPLYGVGPFTLRELVVVAAWLVAFVVSFFPVFVGGPSLWQQGIEWVLPIGVPTVAVFLVVLRRFSPTGIRRVGSLGIDQFASVAFSVAIVVWLGFIWASFTQLAVVGTWPVSWVIWVEFIALAVLVAATVFGPVIPLFADDFRHRPEAPAHPNARDVRPVTPRPAVVTAPTPPAVIPEPDPADYAHQLYEATSRPGPTGLIEGEPWSPTQTRGTYEPIDLDLVEEAGGDAVTDTIPSREQAIGAGAVDDSPAEWDAQERPFAAPSEADAEHAAGQQRTETATAVVEQPRTQAFWALAPEERDVLDEAGRPIFRIGPNAWALVIEDRGGAFVVRHEDGRIGYLHEIDGVTRG